MYVVTVRFQTAPADHAAFLSLITRNAAQSLALEPGCQRFDVCTGDPGTVFLYELYDDEAAFQTHMQSDHFRAFDAATANIVTDKQVATYHLLPPATL